LADFQNSFTDILGRTFAIRLSLKYHTLNASLHYRAKILMLENHCALRCGRLYLLSELIKVLTYGRQNCNFT